MHYTWRALQVLSVMTTKMAWMTPAAQRMRTRAFFAPAMRTRQPAENGEQHVEPEGARAALDDEHGHRGQKDGQNDEQQLGAESHGGGDAGPVRCSGQMRACVVLTGRRQAGSGLALFRRVAAAAMQISGSSIRQ